LVLRGLKHEWVLGPTGRDLAGAIESSTGATGALSRVLVARGISSAADAAAFLEAGTAPLADAHLLPDAGPAVERVSAALARREVIAIHGHDDADGICATAVMVDALAQLGANALTYIPDRRTEGHGLNARELERLAEASVGLIITVDSCVSERLLIASALDMGIDTIVTDHHEIPPALPSASAVVNPKLPTSRFPYRYMAGAGVSLRVADLLIEELSSRFGACPDSPPWLGPRRVEEALALAAVGSIADKVPLTGENRAIVVKGLAALPRTERPGLRALLEESKLWGRQLSPDDVQRCLGPIFGRVSDGRGGNDALDVLLCGDLAEARTKARSLSEARTAWRESAALAWREVSRRVAERPDLVDAPVVVVEAVIPISAMGHVANRLADSTGRPTIVIVRKNGEAVAEARGPLGFNFVPAFEAAADLLSGYGGHPRAAGFSAPSGNVEAFRKRFMEYVSAHPHEPPPRTIDAEIPLGELTPDVALDLERLSPFGLGNGRAVLLARDVSPRSIEQAQASGLHFGVPLDLGARLSDVVYRIRYSDGVAFANFIDTIDDSSPGGSQDGAA
jgi:single-stranded-DNA-specific exonuclease